MTDGAMVYRLGEPTVSTYDADSSCQVVWPHSHPRSDSGVSPLYRPHTHALVSKHYHNHILLHLFVDTIL